MKHLRCIIFFLFLFKQGLNGLFDCVKCLAKTFNSTSSGSSGREMLYSLAIRAICELSVIITSIFGYLGGDLLSLGLDVRRKQRLMRSQCSESCDNCSGSGLRL